MIASLLAVFLLLPQQDIQDYVPGGPERVHADAVEWLHRATERLLEYNALRIEFTETVDGVATDKIFYLRPRVGWEADPPETNSLGTRGIEEFMNYCDVSDAWQFGPLSGNLPILTWMEARGPGLAQLRVELAPNAEVAVRLHWVEDGLRGHVDLDQNAGLLAWTWQGDHHWNRVGKRSARVFELRGAYQEELSSEFRDAVPLFWDVASVHTTPDRHFRWPPAEEMMRESLSTFAKSRGLVLRAELTIQIGEIADESVVLGTINLDGELYWPAVGQLQMIGELGPPDKRKTVDTEICGDGRQLWHWDHVSDKLRKLPGLADLLSGVQGILPVYAWAARAVPDSGWTAEWISEAVDNQRWLRVIDGPTTTDFLFSGRRILEAKVRTTSARSGAPLMHYRFLRLASNRYSRYTDYASVTLPLVQRLDQEQRDQDALDLRIGELLAIGERAPSAVEWATADNSPESLTALRGKPAVLCFWYRDATACEPALQHLARLRGQVDRVGASAHFRAIAIDEPLADAQTWLEEKSIALPLGVGAAAQLKRAFRARWLPTTYLIGTDGVVLGRWLGVPGRDLEEQLRALLARN
jgi:peroxiredoxin